MKSWKQTALRSAAAFAAGGLALSLGTMTAQAEFPDKPIEFVIPFGAGGGADIEGRLLAKEMAKVLGVQVVPINKPGAGGAVTYTYIKNSKPDGYKIAWNSTSILTTTNIGNVPFMHDAMDHIGRVEWQPMVFAVKANAKWKDLKSFAAACKANPKTLKISNSGTGSATHLAAIALANATGCQVVHLPVGIKRRNASVLSGEAHAMAAPLTGAIRLHKAKKMRILAIISAKRNAAVPDVPTAKDAGFNAQLDLFRGLSVPKGTPDNIKKKLGQAMAKAAKSKAFMALAKKKGFTVDPMMSAAFSKLLAAEDKRVKDIMKSAGLYQSKRK